MAHRKWREFHIFSDPWIPRPTSFRPITLPSLDSENKFVSSLIKDAGWDLDAIQSRLWQIDHEEVLSIPLSDRSHEDLVVWHYDNEGSYNVQSGY